MYGLVAFAASSAAHDTTDVFAIEIGYAGYDDIFAYVVVELIVEGHVFEIHTYNKSQVVMCNDRASDEAVPCCNLLGIAKKEIIGLV